MATSRQPASSTQEQTGLHPVTVDKETLHESGKEAGLVNAPIVSVEPQNTNPVQNKPRKHKMVANTIDWLHGYEEQNFEFPYGDIKPGQGMFIALEEGKTIDTLLANIRKQVHKLNEMYSERETNEDGDNILDMVTIEKKKRNDDGTIQLDNGVPRVGANSGHMPRMVRYRQFVVSSVAKGEKVNNETMDSGGVIVTRVY